MIDINFDVAVSVPRISTLLEAKVVRVSRRKEDVDRKVVVQGGKNVAVKCAKSVGAGLSRAAADEADTISDRDAMISSKCQRNRNPRPQVDAVALRLGIRRRTSVDCDKDVWGWRRWRHRRRLRWLGERDGEGHVEKKRQHRSHGVRWALPRAVVSPF